jgi:hypothetical protein
MSTVFVDRESTYPGRYRVIPESGNPYHLILERDDEPVTPGTPLNAETFNGMRDEIDAELAKKAPSGCGYGDKMTFYDVQDGTFETTLDEILSGMEKYSAKQIQFYDPVGLIGNKFIGTLWKYETKYATLEAVTYKGYKAIKTLYNGTWNPWEWINPPFEDNVVYRMVERIGEKVVYKKADSKGVIYWSTDQTTWQHSVNNILSAEDYGASLPAAGNKGRIFFKKV